MAASGGFFEKIQKGIRDTNQVEKAVCLGIFSTRLEMWCLHFWYLVWGFFVSVLSPSAYNSLEAEIEGKFKSILARSWSDDIVSSGNVVVTHSCRTIFYCIIRTLLARHNGKIKICTHSVHFGSFYRILLQINLSDDVEIEFYEIDLHREDWTLDSSSIDENELKSCQLVLCMHLFGVPFDQTAFFELGHKYNIPVVEDCVQSGSLYSNYRGHDLADVCFWSGGMDKTPACLGGGFGFFKDTEHGQMLYEATLDTVSGMEYDTFWDRTKSLLNQWLHLMLAKNYFFILNLIGYSIKSYSGARWHELQLKVRKNKAIAPFQHRKSIYLRKPSMYQLLSIRHGLCKDYRQFAAQEISRRDLFLESIPLEFHQALFPWLTKEVVEAMRQQRGISEFTWAMAPEGQRKDLMDYLDPYLITMVNTTWVHNEQSVLTNNTGKLICENLTYLPNLCELDNRQIKLMAELLTDYCRKRQEEDVVDTNGYVHVDKLHGVNEQKA